MSSVWIRKRGDRFRVEYRTGGRESRPRYGGSFHTRREAYARKVWIMNELAAMRVPNLAALVETGVSPRQDQQPPRERRERRQMATAKTRINVEVTERDIERAHKNDSYKCVVAQAVARIVPDATHVDVDTQTIRFTRQETGERLTYLTPYAVQGYVIAFDAGDTIEPFSFQLRNPVRVGRKVRTEAGRAVHNATEKARREAAKTQMPPSVKARMVANTESPDDPREAAKAAYAEAKAAQKKAPLQQPSVGRKATPRVFKKKRRVYGHRVLRINQEDE